VKEVDHVVDGDLKDKRPYAGASLQVELNSPPVCSRITCSVNSIVNDGK
jgi:hypothetical protein